MMLSLDFTNKSAKWHRPCRFPLEFGLRCDFIVSPELDFSAFWRVFLSITEIFLNYPA